MTSGFTLVELMVTVALLGLMAALGLGGSSEQLARLQVDAAARRLVVGIERGRDAAERTGQECALELNPDGWFGRANAVSLACVGADTPLTESFLPSNLLVGSSFSGALRFTANGLAIDGGTVVVGHVDTTLVRCLVISPPLGVMRVGRYAGALMASPKAEQCLPDPLL